MWELFGLGEADGNTGYFGISGILQWGTQLPYVYDQRKICRGMECDKYDICIQEEGGNTALITYYWSCTWRWGRGREGRKDPVGLVKSKVRLGMLGKIRLN